jgi:hypothetical protein
MYNKKTDEYAYYLNSYSLIDPFCKAICFLHITFIVTNPCKLRLIANMCSSLINKTQETSIFGFRFVII